MGQTSSHGTSAMIFQQWGSGLGSSTTLLQWFTSSLRSGSVVLFFHHENLFPSSTVGSSTSLSVSHRALYKYQSLLLRGFWDISMMKFRVSCSYVYARRRSLTSVRVLRVPHTIFSFSSNYDGNILLCQWRIQWGIRPWTPHRSCQWSSPSDEEWIMIVV